MGNESPGAEVARCRWYASMHVPRLRAEEVFRGSTLRISYGRKVRPRRGPGGGVCIQGPVARQMLRRSAGRRRFEGRSTQHSRVSTTGGGVIYSLASAALRT